MNAVYSTVAVVGAGALAAVVVATVSRSRAPLETSSAPDLHAPMLLVVSLTGACGDSAFPTGGNFLLEARAGRDDGCVSGAVSVGTSSSYRDGGVARRDFVFLRADKAPQAESCEGGC